MLMDLSALVAFICRYKKHLLFLRKTLKYVLMCSVFCSLSKFNDGSLWVSRPKYLPLRFERLIKIFT